MSDDWKHIYNDQKVPKGFTGYLNESVVGTSFRCKDAIAWAKSKDISLILEREPDNKVDENAIKVIGKSKGFFGTKTRHLGYVEKDLAQRLVKKDFVDKVYPWLRDIGIHPNEDAISIKYELVVLNEFSKELEKILRGID